MKHLYIIILILMIAYIALDLYFEHRLDKRIRQYEERENARSAKKRAR
jgi:hypothetical protein